MTMINALSPSSGPPPAPDINSQNALGAPTGAPAPGGAPGQPGQQAAPPVPPSHQQTVAALRHFNAVEQELSSLLTDPDCGKADLKSKIIDGATGLVSKGILTPSDAVSQLGTVPDRPFEQKQWLQTHFAQTVQAADNVLAMHGAAFGGSDFGPQPPSNPDDHSAVVQGLMSQMRGPSANG